MPQVDACEYLNLKVELGHQLQQMNLISSIPMINIENLRFFPQ